MILEKNLKFSVPGKTFLVGEYAVLAGGECLGLATNPSFSICTEPKGHCFHPDSPAGLYLKNNQLENFEHEFINPYGAGGFGASTAEFIFSYFSNSQASKKLEDIFSAYLNLYADRGEQKPSGADLITQLIGEVSHIDLSDVVPRVERTQWNFPDIDFMIFSTGLKVKTHEHLAGLNRKICDGLVPLSRQVVSSFRSNNSLAFKEALSEWSKKLEQLGLMDKKVSELKTYLQNQVSEILVKPCGALGADVIVILCAKEQKQFVFEQIGQLHVNGLRFQADSTCLANGPLSI